MVRFQDKEVVLAALRSDARALSLASAKLQNAARTNGWTTYAIYTGLVEEGSM